MIISRSVKLVALGSLLFVLVVISWGLNRGLDPMDEGFYLLSFSPVQPSGLKISYWWIFVRYMSQLLPKSIVTYRVMRLAISVLSSSFFALGFWTWFRYHWKFEGQLWKPAIIVPFIILGGLLDFVDGPLSYSYDHMNGHLLQFISGLLLFFLALKSKHFEYKSIFFLLWMCTGFFVGIQIFVKISTAVLIFVLIQLFLWLPSTGDVISWRKWSLFGFVIGLIAGIVLSVNMLGGIHTWFALLKDFSFVAEQTSHNIIFVLYFSYLEVFSEGMYILTYYIPLFLSIFLLVWFFRKGWRPTKEEKDIYLIIVGFIFVSFLYATFQASRRNPHATFHLSMLFLFLIIFAAFAWDSSLRESDVKFRPRKNWLNLLFILIGFFTSFIFMKALLQESSPWVLKMHKIVFSLAIGLLLALTAIFWQYLWLMFLRISKSEKQLILIYLLVVPLLGSFGTNAGFIDKTLHQDSHWFAALLIIFVQIWKKTEVFKIPFRKIIISSMIMLVTLLSSLQIVYGYMLRPYHLPTNLLSQSHLIENVQSLKGIKVDLETKHFYETLNKIISENADFQPGDPVIGLYGIPGFVYALGGSSPGVVYFPSNIGMEGTCKLLEIAQVELEDAIILANRELDDHTNCLPKLHIHYPEDYRLAETLDITYSYMAERGQDKLSVFVPITE